MYSSSSVDETLGCYRVLAILNKAAMNICVKPLCGKYKSTYIFFSNKCSEVKLLGHDNYIFNRIGHRSTYRK